MEGLHTTKPEDKDLQDMHILTITPLWFSCIALVKETSCTKIKATQ